MKKPDNMNTKSWKDIKDDVYGKNGTERRDQLERDLESIKIGILPREAINSVQTFEKNM